MRARKLEDLKSENEALEMKVRELEQERDELYKRSETSVQEEPQEDERFPLLEHKGKTLTARLEKIEAQIISVSSASNMDPAVLDGLLNDIEEKLDNRNNTIKMLQQQKATISKASSAPEDALVRSVERLTVEDVSPKMRCNNTQPPKNKGKSKKPAKARSPVLINGLTKDELSKEQMEEHAAQLREELEREREERNYFQLERDKMFGFMETTQRKLEDLKAELKIVNKEIEEDERRHQTEIKVYKQKVKHVLCEHQNVISGLSADAVVLAEAMQKEQQQLEAEIHLEQEAIAVDMQDVESEQLAWEIELQKHNEELSKVKDSGEKQCAEVIAKYERKMQLIPQDMENIRKTQMSERRQHWDDQMASLIEDHDRAVRDWDVVIAHIKQDADLNLSLKAQIKDMKTKRCLKDAEVARVLPDNRRISDALLKLEKKITENEKKGGTQEYA
eukprot:XP_011608664.1 PREDICTED: growth arrest-specific protein 8-like [Takifugu rubripes]